MKQMIIKGTVIGLGYDSLTNDDFFHSNLLSFLETWRIKNFEINNIPKSNLSEEVLRENGRIKAAYYSIESDIHNLSISYNLLTHLIKNKDLGNSITGMYLSLLFENYIINLRSMYDYSTYFSRLVLLPKDLKEFKKCNNHDSLNTFIKFYNNLPPKSVNLELLQLTNETKSQLEDIRKIRDLIVHKGKEPIVQVKNEKYLLHLPKDSPYGAENSLPNILQLKSNTDPFPLHEYLKTLTIKLINYTEKLGDILIQESIKKDKNYKLELTALTGICINDFNQFLKKT